VTVVRRHVLRRGAVAGTALVVGGALAAAPAWAWWSDTATVTTTATTTALAAPTAAKCTNNALSTPTLSWTAPTAAPVPTGYLLTISGTGVNVGTTTTATVTTTSWQFNAVLLGLTGTFTVGVQSTYYNWVSPASLSLGNVSVTVAVGTLGVASCA
jgi:hypothetical protein